MTDVWLKKPTKATHWDLVNSIPTLRLLHDLVLIRRLEIPPQTRGGIILPLKAIELPQLGHVVAIGPRNPDQIQIGEMVLMKKFEGHRLFLNGEELHLMHIEDLLAAIKE
jgi:chaperonin GroES